jgi:NDP-sugar pyrophosphorylase family protein
MACRVCIPVAGLGSRLGNLTKFVNKALVSVGNRPIICHIIEQFPEETEYVIALGYKGNLVREFIRLAYPNRTFFFSEVTPFEGPMSGLGLSLLSCKDYLQQPFIFISCDTLVKGYIPSPTYNWMAFSDVNEQDSYRTISLAGDHVSAICEKNIGRLNTHHAYIGMAGIFDYSSFWKFMDEGGQEAIEIGESYALKKLISLGIRAHKFNWFDTGNIEALERARVEYQEKDGPNILEKSNEAIWFVGNKVIKYSDDTNFIKNRVVRAAALKGYVPDVSDSTLHMYKYPKAEGKVFSEIVTIPGFESLLNLSSSFWQLKKLSANERKKFNQTCLIFYFDKTHERVKLFYEKFEKQDGAEEINGIQMPTLHHLLNTIDWEWLADGLPGRFHGDFHFENILLDAKSERFWFLDWRQDFGGDLFVGDIYYDFAKLLHGLIINHELIAKNHFIVDWKDEEISYDFYRKQMLVDCEVYFYEWLKKSGYDPKKVRILTALIYLNIAALHHYPYSLLLYGLGKSMLKENGG